MKATVLDGISRDLSEGATRRGLLHLLGRVTAVAAVGAIGASGLNDTAAAKRRGRKRRKRNTNGDEQQEQYQVLPGGETTTAAAKSIPPNCIYVCCDEKCDLNKLCLKCVKWPKPTITTVIAAQ